MGAGAGRGGAHPLTRVRLALHPRLPPNKHTRSRAPAQRCTHACHLISTPTHVQHMPERLLRVGWAGVRLWGGLAHPLTHAHPALRTCLPPSKRTRSRVTDGVGYWGGGVGWGWGWGWGLGPGWGTCSRAPAQHCIHASHLTSAPAHVHPPSTACMPAT